MKYEADISCEMFKEETEDNMSVDRQSVSQCSLLHEQVMNNSTFTIIYSHYVQDTRQPFITEYNTRAHAHTSESFRCKGESAKRGSTGTEPHTHAVLRPLHVPARVTHAFI